MEQRKGQRLVLFPFPFQGHINPIIQLGNILHSKGFSITIICTNFNSPNPSNYPDFDFHFINENLSEDEKCNPNIVALIQLINVRCAQPLRDCLAELLSNVSKEPIACLISDFACHFTQAVADELKLKRIVMRTGGATSSSAYAAFPLLREKGYLPLQDSQLEKLVVELAPLRVKDLPLHDSCAPDEYYQLVDDMVNMTRTSSGFILNSFEDLEQPALATLRQEFGIPVFPIGPFHKRFPASLSSLLTQDQSCISWLDKQGPRSVVYVSFGSLTAVYEMELLEIAWGLTNSKQPFLWVVRPGSTINSDWLEAMPKGFLEALDERGCIVMWAPQQEVLAHPAIGAFWTHNGWNSTLESICEGVPMICMPFFMDQRVNARYVTEVWGVGVQLEKRERGMIERVIKGVMMEEEGEEIRGRALILKEKATQCLHEGGSSYQSLDSLVSHISSP
ncbi:hypothetical protein SLEP1_g5819 [Rubroshorea leprosula]|uniref:UDP-glycosyltransferase n=1 Tax=Rubroshorea leprosula TaxID=152421 RepID=A0AAV5I216_9ROSI|nr:hypothetical protein SLEP1_g5819 [Rubroshorea leprosula]